MNKFTINAEICRKPVVNMATGSVIAKAFIPYYNKATLTLEYISLALNDGDTLNLPFSALRFMNDVCTMILIPDAPYIPEKGKNANLIGTDLNAKAGSYILFSFGTVVSTDVDESGRVLSLLMDNGKNYPVNAEPAEISFDGKESAEAKAAAAIAAAAAIKAYKEEQENEAAAAAAKAEEPLKINRKNEQKLAPKEAQDVKFKELKTELKSELKTELKTELKSELSLPPLSDDKDVHNQPKKIPQLAKKDFAVAVPAGTAASKPKQSAEPAEEPAKDEQKLPAAPENKEVKEKTKWADKIRFAVHRFLPPIAAMFIFMILYFMVYHLFIE